MTIHEIDGKFAKIMIAALIKGDGVDLVVQPAGAPSRTVQLSCEEALDVAAALIASAQQSRKDA